MALGVGDPAPDFTLAGTGGTERSLADFRGRPVVLAFYPGDNTSVCTAQLDSYQADLAKFTELDAQVVGISPDPVESHNGFACRQGYTFPLLADVDKAVGKAYGILGPLGFYRRSIFVLDAQGIVRYVHRSANSLTFKPTEDLLAAVRAAS